MQRQKSIKALSTRKTHKSGHQSINFTIGRHSYTMHSHKVNSYSFAWHHQGAWNTSSSEVSLMMSIKSPIAIIMQNQMSLPIIAFVRKGPICCGKKCKYLLTVAFKIWNKPFHLIVKAKCHEQKKNACFSDIYSTKNAGVLCKNICMYVGNSFRSLMCYHLDNLYLCLIYV